MRTGKHAYLVIAHNNFIALEMLIKLLDDIRNDIYIHIDKKVNNFDFDKFRNIPKKSKVIFTERIKTKWGDFSLVECELTLLKAASLQKYDFYHLMSGVDLPIKTQDYIHDFFDQNQDKIFVNLSVKDWDISIINRVKYYYPLTYKHSSRGVSLICSAINHSLLGLQKVLRVNRMKGNPELLCMGSNWFSIPDSVKEYVLDNEQLVREKYRYTFCSDELFLQTLIGNSQYVKDLYESSSCDSNMRLIDWNRGLPYIWRNEDYPILMNSDCLFARKFDYSLDSTIIKRIYDHISKNQLQRAT